MCQSGNYRNRIDTLFILKWPLERVLNRIEINTLNSTRLRKSFHSFHYLYHPSIRISLYTKYFENTHFREGRDMNNGPPDLQKKKNQFYTVVIKIDCKPFSVDTWTVSLFKNDQTSRADNYTTLLVGG